MNLGEGQTELAARGFDYLSPTRLTLMLNRGKDDFEDQWSWPWLATTVNGTAPLDVDRLRNVIYIQDTDNDAELFGLDVRQIAQGGTPVDRSGTPENWWLDGPVGADETVTINVWPVAAVALQARVTIGSPALEQPTDTPLIPARYHWLWIDFAVIAAYQDSDNYVAARELRADLVPIVGDLIERYETRNRQHAEPATVYAQSEDD